MTELTALEKRVIYRARRGLKELDVYIDVYVKTQYATANAQDKAAFALLVEQEDPDLLDWFMDSSVSDDAELNRIIKHIKQTCKPNMD